MNAYGEAHSASFLFGINGNRLNSDATGRPLSCRETRTLNVHRFLTRPLENLLRVHLVRNLTIT